MDPNNGSVLVKSLEHSLKPCCLNVDYLENIVVHSILK